MTAAPDQTQHLAMPDEAVAFDTVRGGGYHPEQVDSFIRRMMDRLHDAEQRLASFGRDAEHTLVKAAESPQAARLVSELMQLAADELTGQKVAAQQEMDRLLSQAATQAAQLLDEAKGEAASISDGARQQAETVIEGARAQARQMISQADAQATAVREGAEARLKAMVTQHAEAMRRIGQVNEVTSQVMAAEAGRGSLTEEVNRVLDAAGQPALRPAPQPVDAGEPAAEEPAS